MRPVQRPVLLCLFGVYIISIFSGCAGSGQAPVSQGEPQGDPLQLALRDFAPKARNSDETFEQAPSMGLDPNADPDFPSDQYTGMTPISTGTTTDAPTPMGLARTPGDTSSAPEQTTWSVVLVSLTGLRAEADANKALQHAHTAGFDATVQRRGSSFVVATGSFNEPGDPDAQRTLKQVQSYSTGASRPFAQAILMPPSAFMSGSLPEFDLQRVKASYGKSALYTLQIAVYRRDDLDEPTKGDLKEFREAAEWAVVELRKEGVPAFYSHGRNSSSVTVGVFGDEDYKLDPRTSQGIEGLRLGATRERFPHLILNGQTLFQGGSTREMSSLLVNVPSQ